MLPNPLQPLAPFLPRIVATVAVVALVLLLTRLGRRGLQRLVSDPRRRYRGYKMIGRIAALVVGTSLVFLWAPVRRDLLTVFTIVGTGAAIATREAVLSMIGWLHLAVRAPYRHGDRIEVNGIHGDVVDIRLLHTTIVEVGGWVGGGQSTGRLIHIPNNWVFLHPVVNDTHGFGFVWNEFTVTVTHDSDWAAARDLLERLADEAEPAVEARARERLSRLSEDYLVHYSVLTPFVYVSVSKEGITLTLRHLVEVRKRRGVDHALTTSFLDGIRDLGTVKMATD